MDRSLEEGKKADYHAGRAEAAENNIAISSDDPAAIEKLEEKIARLERQQQNKKAINKYYQKHGTYVGFEGMSDEEAKKLDKQNEEGFSRETAPLLTSLQKKRPAESSLLTEEIFVFFHCPLDGMQFTNTAWGLNTYYGGAVR